MSPSTVSDAISCTPQPGLCAVGQQLQLLQRGEPLVPRLLLHLAPLLDSCCRPRPRLLPHPAERILIQEVRLYVPDRGFTVTNLESLRDWKKPLYCGNRK